ncbi:MAG: YczE/YyaS/YitT family protein [Cellulosilyticaceae bacterium]
MREKQIKRFVILVVGTILIGLGIAIFGKANMGVDPFTLMNKGLSKGLGINFSIVQWSVSLLILVGVFFIDKKKIYIGTVLNMVMVAPCIQLFGIGLDRWVPSLDYFVLKIAAVVLGCIILCLGVGMYLATDLGMAPYDLVAIMIAEKTQGPFKWLRIMTDVICVSIGGLLGAQVGLGTLVATFGMGPLIDYFKKKFDKMLAQKS